MSLKDKNSILGPSRPEKYYQIQNDKKKDSIENEFLTKNSIFIPLKFVKYDPSNIRVLGGQQITPSFTPPAPEPPPPPAIKSFSNAFSNAFNTI